MVVVDEAVQHEAHGDEHMVFVGMEFLKARPSTEGARRYLYFEASNESWDQQQEPILKRARLDWQDVCLAEGNIDIGRSTILGHKLGIRILRERVIAVPLEDGEELRSVLVKREIYPRG